MTSINRLTPFVAAVFLAGATAFAQTPQAAVDGLLAADRAFAAAAAKTDAVTAIAAMLADDVIMPAPPGKFAHGKREAVDAMRANPANSGAKAEWAPLRGGVSGDGLHGFTYGYMTIRRADGTTANAKYLSYWVKGASGWRVAVYRRSPRADGEVSASMLAPALPAALGAPSADRVAIEAHRASVVAAEKAFSDLAQRVGLEAAFRENGRPDAMNMGGGAAAAFVIGNEAIAKSVSAGQPAGGSTLNWSADTALVATSGDLGVTIGFIRQNNPPAGAAPTPGFPFFTIWWRERPGAPWRYIAE